jgi:hypothetical protein
MPISRMPVKKFVTGLIKWTCVLIKWCQLTLQNRQSKNNLNLYQSWLFGGLQVAKTVIPPIQTKLILNFTKDIGMILLIDLKKKVRIDSSSVSAVPLLRMVNTTWSCSTFKMIRQSNTHCSPTTTILMMQMSKKVNIWCLLWHNVTFPQR